MRVIPATDWIANWSRAPKSASVSAPAPPSIRSLPPMASITSSADVPVIASDPKVPNTGATAPVARFTAPDQVCSRSAPQTRETLNACSPAA